MSKRVGGARLCQLRLVPVPMSRPESSAALPARAEPPSVSVVDDDDEVQVLAVTTTNSAAPASFSFSDAFKCARNKVSGEVSAPVSTNSTNRMERQSVIVLPNTSIPTVSSHNSLKRPQSHNSVAVDQDDDDAPVHTASSRRRLNSVIDEFDRSDVRAVAGADDAPPPMERYDEIEEIDQPRSFSSVLSTRRLPLSLKPAVSVNTARNQVSAVLPSEIRNIGAITRSDVPLSASLMTLSGRSIESAVTVDDDIDDFDPFALRIKPRPNTAPVAHAPVVPISKPQWRPSFAAVSAKSATESTTPNYQDSNSKQSSLSAAVTQSVAENSNSVSLMRRVSSMEPAPKATPTTSIALSKLLGERHDESRRSYAQSTSALAPVLPSYSSTTQKRLSSVLSTINAVAVKPESRSQSTLKSISASSGSRSSALCADLLSDAPSRRPGQLPSWSSSSAHTTTSTVIPAQSSRATAQRIENMFNLAPPPPQPQAPASRFDSYRQPDMGARHEHAVSADEEQDSDEYDNENDGEDGDEDGFDDDGVIEPGAGYSFAAATSVRPQLPPDYAQRAMIQGRARGGGGGDRDAQGVARGGRGRFYGRGARIRASYRKKRRGTGRGRIGKKSASRAATSTPKFKVKSE